MFEAAVGLGDRQKYSLVVDRFRYQLMAMEEQTLSVGLERKTGVKSEYKADADQYTLVRKKMRAWSLRDIVRFYGFPNEVVAYYQNAGLSRSLTYCTKSYSNGFLTCGPLRTKAERLYSWGGVNPESVGFSGENTVAAILSARNRKISLGYKRPKSLSNRLSR